MIAPSVIADYTHNHLRIVSVYGRLLMTIYPELSAEHSCGAMVHCVQASMLTKAHFLLQLGSDMGQHKNSTGCARWSCIPDLSLSGPGTRHWLLHLV
jgi:hypothetical protein